MRDVCEGWLVGDGEMAELIRAKKWETTPLGAIASWPQSLRTMVNLALASRSPLSVLWGSDHTQIYNDGYRPICGTKHPTSMGQDYRECWASSLPATAAAYDAAWAGAGVYVEKQRMFIDRRGFLEETWFTYSFSPITNESGRVGGLFHAVTELTDQMLSERRALTLRDLALSTTSATSTEEVLRHAAKVFEDTNLDVPFTVFYIVSENSAQAVRIASSGINPEDAGPEIMDLRPVASMWSLGEVHRSGQCLQVDAQVHGAVGPYAEVPGQALVLPIWQAGLASPVALLVAGISVRLAITEEYRRFFELVTKALTTSLMSVLALESERRRAADFAELHRAKTEFLSNVSHELRTPLTLILGPLEEELAEPTTPLPAARRARIQIAHRNGLRMLKLVNALLDFSRLEARRLQPSCERIDLAVETAHLAEVFRPAIERAGLTLTVTCPSLPTPIYIDREMWESIVLNLLSNALKHTLAGGIIVALSWQGDRVALSVTDTGIGIRPEDRPRVFERFHQVKGAWARSNEGSGLGLAIVRELASLMGGAVALDSVEGVGSTFTVTVMPGLARLATDRRQIHEARLPTRTGAAFVLEAQQWLPDGTARPASDAASMHSVELRPRVVLADDSADMRAYVTGLLEPWFDVVAVGDGEAALHEIRTRTPDLVLCDIVMPKLNGFELLAALRADPETRALPVIMLSARAGLDASEAGLDAGADDYLIKPFSARELIARVRTHVALQQTRREWINQLEGANLELAAFSDSVSHDLRAPLRAITNFSDILLENHPEDATKNALHCAERIRASALRMTELIDDLFALSKAGRCALHKSPIDLTALARQVIDELRAETPERVVDVDVAEGLIAVCDNGLMAIVVRNLLANAWKFTANRAHAAISVGLEDGDVFFVRDNGVGFDAVNASRLFEPFLRLHPEKEFEGTGIGLALVHRIIERHGGRVWAQGAVGRGATIRFTLEPNGLGGWRSSPEPPRRPRLVSKPD